MLSGFPHLKQWYLNGRRSTGLTRVGRWVCWSRTGGTLVDGPGDDRRSTCSMRGTLGGGYTLTGRYTRDQRLRFVILGINSWRTARSR